MSRYSPEFFEHVSNSLSAGVIVEIGARVGEWAAGALKACPGSKIFCIDPWPKRSRRGLQDSFPQWVKNVSPYAFTRAIPIRGASIEWAKVWPDELRPSVVYVDGDHRRAAVRADANLWWDLLLPGGVMYFHDTNEPEVLAGMHESEIPGSFTCESWGPRRGITTHWIRKSF